MSDKNQPDVRRLAALIKCCDKIPTEWLERHTLALGSMGLAYYKEPK